MTNEVAIYVALISGWLALVLMIAWPEPKHCPCCAKKQRPTGRRNH